nr:MAG TPA: putative antitoxin of bacterial toxin-antitoxin system, YdaS/YdaT [Caudoviricetes sp.]
MLPRAKNYLRSLRRCERAALAERCGVALKTIQNITYGKNPSISLACRIAEQSSGAVTPRDLRPDVDWDLIDSTLSKKER